ncbi:MAG TPA: hypothetical protein VJ739_09675 [Gemmataceae bacterium]|nr:hypothetical protein [Gemmataceae bacterium]
MEKAKVYADFHNTDARGRIRLNCIGTVEDLSQQGVKLQDGLVLTLYADDLDDKGRPDELLADGVVAFSEEEHCWVAAVDWAKIHHASDDRQVQAGSKL